MTGYFDEISSVNTSRLGSCGNFFLNLTAWGDFATLHSSCPDGAWDLEVPVGFLERLEWVEFL